MAELWNELHTRALNHDGSDDTKYLIEFSKRIPRYTTGCACREFWNNWIRSNPPKFDDYFKWTVDTHNAVNAKLNKPKISLDMALEMFKNR